MNTSESSGLECLKSCWEKTSTEERDRFLIWAELISKDTVKEQLQEIGTIEEIDEFLTKRLEDLKNRFALEFEEDYRVVSSHFSDLHDKVTKLLSRLT